MIVKAEEIIDYIPQRHPMIMVGGLLAVDEKMAQTCFSIEQHNIFVSDGYFSESGLIEHIAQSAALHAGYGFIKSGKPVPVGYIAAVKDLVIYFLPQAGQELVTTVRITNKVLEFTIINAEVTCRDQLAVRCEMRIYIKD